MLVERHIIGSFGRLTSSISISRVHSVKGPFLFSFCYSL